MQFLTREDRGCTVIEVHGRLDSSGAQQFDQRSSDLLGGGATRLVLDLSSLEYVSSAGLRSVLTAAKGARAAGGELVIAGLRGVTKEVFSISGFDTILPTFPDVDAALSAS